MTSMESRYARLLEKCGGIENLQRIPQGMFETFKTRKTLKRKIECLELIAHNLDWLIAQGEAERNA